MTSTLTSCQLDLAVLGTTVRVHLQDARDRPAVAARWHLCLLPDAQREVPAESVVRLPATADDGARSAALTQLTQAVTRCAITARTGQLLMLHAGALSNSETGATVAYVAPGGTGKTTITVSLGAGRGYVTDETVGVTREGVVEEYCKPLSVRRPDGGGKDEVAPEELGLRRPAAEPWLARLLVVRRDPHHVGRPAPRSLGLLDAIAALSPETSALAALPRPLRACRDIVERAGGLAQVTFRDARDLDDIVADALGRSRP